MSALTALASRKKQEETEGGPVPDRYPVSRCFIYHEDETNPTRQPHLPHRMPWAHRNVRSDGLEKILFSPGNTDPAADGKPLGSCKV